MKLVGKIAIITGAGSGIGRAVARRFAEEGAKVIIAEQQAHTGEETRRLITQAGGEAKAIRTDVSQTTDVENMIRETLAWAGSIDILVQCAGVENRPGPLTSCRASDFDRVMAVNVRGPFLCTREVVKQMIAQKKGGCILALASYAAMQPAPDLAPYAASKAAVIALLRTTAAEVAEFGISVNPVCHGVIQAASNAGRLKHRGEVPVSSPEDVADTLLRLAAGELDHASGDVVDLTQDPVAS